MRLAIPSLLILIPMFAWADVNGKEIFKNAAIGVGVVITLSIVVGIYKLGRVAVRKINPRTPLWCQRLIGLLAVLAGFSIWFGLAG